MRNDVGGKNKPKGDNVLFESATKDSQGAVPFEPQIKKHTINNPQEVEQTNNPELKDSSLKKGSIASKSFLVSDSKIKYHNVIGKVSAPSHNDEKSLVTYAVNAIIGKEGFKTSESSDWGANEELIALVNSVKEANSIINSLSSAIGKDKDIYLLQETRSNPSDDQSAMTSHAKRRGTNKSSGLGQIIGVVIGEGDLKYAIAKKEKPPEGKKLRFYEYRNEKEMIEIVSPTREQVQLFADKLGVGDIYRQKYAVSTALDLKRSSTNGEAEEKENAEMPSSPTRSSSGSAAEQLINDMKMIRSDGHEGGAYQNTDFKFRSEKGYLQAKEEAIDLLKAIICLTSKEIIDRYIAKKGSDRDDNTITKEDVLNVIDFATKYGGVKNIIREKEGGGREFVRNEFLTKDDLWALDFSSSFQKACKECGIYAPMNNTSGNLAGMPLSRIPPEVLQQFKEQNIDNIIINQEALHERKNFVSEKNGMTIA